MLSRDSDRRNVGVQVLQYGVGLGILIWFLQQFSLTRLWTFVIDLPVPIIVALLVVSVAGQLALYGMWYALCNGFASTDYASGAKISLTIDFVNLAVPSRLPAIALNPLMIRQFTSLDDGESVAVTLVHTSVFALCYGIVGLVGLFVAASGLSNGVLLVVVTAVCGYVFAGISTIVAARTSGRLPTLIGPLRAVLARVPDVMAERLRSAASVPAEALADYERLLGQRRVLGTYLLAWIGGILFPSGVRVWLLLSVSGVDPPSLLVVPALTLTAYAVTILPISVGGIGVAEATATLVFVSLGYPFEIAGPIVLVDRTLNEYLPGLAGAYPATSINLPRIG